MISKKSSTKPIMKKKFWRPCVFCDWLPMEPPCMKKKYHYVLADCVDVNQMVRTVANEIPTSNEPIRNPCNDERCAEIFNRFVCLINLNSLIQSEDRDTLPASAFILSFIWVTFMFTSECYLCLPFDYSRIKALVCFALFLYILF